MRRRLLEFALKLMGLEKFHTEGDNTYFISYDNHGELTLFCLYKYGLYLSQMAMNFALLSELTGLVKGEFDNELVLTEAPVLPLAKFMYDDPELCMIKAHEGVMSNYVFSKRREEVIQFFRISYYRQTVVGMAQFALSKEACQKLLDYATINLKIEGK